MRGGLLTTKFYLPPARANCVPRARLTKRLADGLGRRLMLLSAPPGFGKTSLLAECIADLSALHAPPGSIALRFAWLSLDDADNDVVRYLTYVIAACQMVWPELGVSALEMLATPQPPPADVLLTDFINDAAGAQPFVLVLDDYHVIHAQARCTVAGNSTGNLLNVDPRLDLDACPQFSEPGSRYRLAGSLSDPRPARRLAAL